MRFVFVAGLFWSAAGFAAASDFVDIRKVDFTVRLDIRYATPNNFMKKAVYPEAKCALRKPVAIALSKAQSELKLVGLSLKVYDCYRPLSVQRKLWEITPDERYVANPEKGSKHNRGAAVDLTMVDTSGNELEMPSRYDEFTERAHRNYQGGSKKALANRKRLEEVMTRAGFAGLDTEWWHFDYKGWEKYDLEDVSLADIQ